MNWSVFSMVQFSAFLKIGSQGVQELFFVNSKPLELAALSGLLTVKIMLIQLVCWLRTYRAKKKIIIIELFHHRCSLVLVV